MSAYAFWIVLALSIVLVLCFFWGARKNLTMAKEMSERLEVAFKPKDKNYTWLGGVMGFAAEFKVEGFEKIYINFRLIPRQSILWLPFSLLLGRRDSVQLLFYFKNGQGFPETHVVKKGFFKPQIPKKSLKKKEKENFEVWFESEELVPAALALSEKFKEKFYHLALSGSVAFLEFRGMGLVDWMTEQKLSGVIKSIQSLRRQFHRLSREGSNR